ncbi:MAG: hypothetical protein JO307_04560 [Bryobacterales bacterium]|nr:hypothetical protein [Bryobacterales bacterium]MBV9397772.1 hypothetical protein [Bryobacterales bacterium]
MRTLLLLSCAALAACVSPQESGVKVIVGARLGSVDHSVVVISNGKFQAVGPQATTPVPKGAEITGGLGMTIEPLAGGGAIEPGQPANLVLKGGANERMMRNGEWVSP